MADDFEEFQFAETLLSCPASGAALLPFQPGGFNFLSAPPSGAPMPPFMEALAGLFAKPVWDVRDVSAFLGLKPYTIRSWVRRRKIPAHVLSERTIRFVPRSVVSWFMRHKRKLR